MVHRTVFGTLCLLSVMSAPSLGEGPGTYEIWKINGGIAVVHFLEGLMNDMGISLPAVEETASIPDMRKLRTEPPNLLFEISAESTLRFGVFEGQFHDQNMLDGQVVCHGGMIFQFEQRSPQAGTNSEPRRVDLRNFIVRYEHDTGAALASRPDGERFVFLSTAGGESLRFHLAGGMIGFMDSTRTRRYDSASPRVEPYSQTNFLDPAPVLWIGYMDLKISPELAKEAGRPELAGAVIGMLEINGIAARTGREYVGSRESVLNLMDGVSPGAVKKAPQPASD